MKEQVNYVDRFGKKLKVGDNVIVRHSFPRTAKLSTGTITDFRITLNLDFQVKIKGHKEWFFNPIKLAK